MWRRQISGLRRSALEEIVSTLHKFCEVEEHLGFARQIGKSRPSQDRHVCRSVVYGLIHKINDYRAGFYLAHIKLHRIPDIHVVLRSISSIGPRQALKT